MNPRLLKGAMLGRFTAALLASSVLISTVPAMAAEADANAIQGNELTVKTLPPLAEAEAASAAEPSAVASDATPSKPVLRFSPGTAQEQAENSATAVAAAPAAGTALSPNPAPVEDTSASSTESGTTASTTEGAVAAAPAEVTEPQSLASDDDKKELAQGTPNTPRSPLDPAYKKLPSTIGTVKIRRGFDRFPTNAIIHNLAFRETPVKEVISEIGRRGNLNIIIDKSVVGRITGDLHDVTLNEAMDTVLASSGMQWRQLDNSTVIIGSPNALANLGLNRPIARTFKLSYTTAFDVSNLLWASVFNRGFIPDYSQAVRNRTISTNRETPQTKTAESIERGSQAPAPGGGMQTSKTTSLNAVTQDQNEENEQGEELNQTTRPDTQRTMRAISREQVNEGTGFNSGAIDPGSQTIRARATVVSDYNVDQNGGGAICIPDSKNNQIIVVGTEQDLQIAEEAIRLIDRRPKQIHIQTSLVELTNQGIRQLGASLDLQGAGASSTVLGGSGAPLINFLPGLGSAQQFVTNIVNGNQTSVDRVAGIPPMPVQFAQSVLGSFLARSLGTAGVAPSNAAGTGTLGLPSLTTVNGPPANGFNGFIGNALPLNTPSIAGVQAVPQAQTGFNFLTLGRDAGGRANIATVPTALNMSINLVLQTNKAKLLANPSVVVNDNTESLITLANEVVHKVTTTISLGVVSTNVELVKAGIFLNVLPRVSEDGFITMRLRPQVSSPLGGPQTFANGNVVVTLLNVREIMTQEVRVKDGQTLVIGGLFSEQEAATLAKVPYLAEAPILGALFRNSIKGRNRAELMLMLTPKIVEEAPAEPIAEGGSSSPTM